MLSCARMDSPTPAAAQPVLPPYASATQFSWQQAGLMLALLAAFLIAVALPWMVVAQATPAGLDFDTWKPASPGAPLSFFLPPGAVEATQLPDGLLANYGEGRYALVQEFPDHAAAVAA